MHVPLPIPFAARPGWQNDEIAMDPSTRIVSYSFFGIRVDIATPAHATLSIWEGVLARSGLRVVLADLWTFLFAQRDYSVWEALSSADYVLPAGNPAILRRLMRRRDVPILQPDLLLADLLDAAMRNDKVVALLAPEDEVSSDVALARQVWPTLQAAGLSKNTVNTSQAADPELVRAVNVIHPDVLVVGGDSPWQERWMHEHRGTLDVGIALLLPTLHTALAACAQRAGVPVAGLGRLRRQATLQRALATTIGPMATASAATVGSWLKEARGGLSEWSDALQSHRGPAALRRLDVPALPAGSHVTVHVAELRDSEEIEAVRRLGASPLARLAPPRAQSSPPNGTMVPSGQTPLAEAERRAAFADQPTVALTVDALRGNTPPPQVVTGYVVETIDNTSPEEGAGIAADGGQGSGDEHDAGAEDVPLPSPPIAPGQLAATTRLAARFAAAAASASAATDSSANAAVPAPVEPGPTRLLPNRVPQAPTPPDLPPTTLLRPFVVAAAGEAATMPQDFADGERAPTAGTDAETGTSLPPEAMELRVPGRAAIRPLRARRLYKAKRPRRQLARRRRRKPTRQSQRG